MISLPLSDNNIPLYKQIYNHIKKEIQNKSIKAFEKLPSKRKLASYLDVSVNTVDTAYNQLTAEGYIYALPRKGYFVSDIDEYHHIHIEKDNIKFINEKSTEIEIDFSPSDIDHDAFPFNTWRTLIKDCFNEYNRNLFKRNFSQGDLDLRKALVKFLHSSRGVICSYEQIVIGAGTDHLLQMLSILFGKNYLIALENPVYRKAYKIFEHMGHEVLSVPIDNKGIIIEPLENFTDIVVYITPSHQFPLGISMPIGRRIKLLNYAQQNKNRYIIEDDYDSEFRYTGKPLPSLQSIDKTGKVIYIGTFSKAIAPSIRISYMVLPQSLLLNYKEKCDEFNTVVSSFEQKLLEQFIDKGYFEKHLNKMRKLYKEKRQHLISELSIFNDDIKIVGEDAGHHLLIKLNNHLTEQQMCLRAQNARIKVYPISDYFIGEVPKEHMGKILLGYGALTNKEITKGVATLHNIWK